MPWQAVSCTHALKVKRGKEGEKKKREKVSQTHTQTASPHLRNVTGLLLHCKPTGALNKHLFLPVNPRCLRHAASTGTRHPHGSAPFSSFHPTPAPPQLLRKAFYTLTFGIQIKKRGQGEAERITGAYGSDSRFIFTRT